MITIIEYKEPMSKANTVNLNLLIEDKEGKLLRYCNKWFFNKTKAIEYAKDAITHPNISNEDREDLIANIKYIQA